MASGTSFDDAIELTSYSYSIPFTTNRTEYYFKIRPVTGTSYTLETTGLTDTYLELYDVNKTLIHYDDNSSVTNNAKISFISFDSTYYVRVRAVGSISSLTTSTLYYIIGSSSGVGTSFDNAITLSTGSLPVTFTPSHNKIYYVIYPEIGKQLTLETTGSNDTYLHLYNSNKTQISYNDDGGSGTNAKISLVTTMNKYYIQLRTYSTPSRNVTSTFSYTLEKVRGNGNSFATAAEYEFDEGATYNLGVNTPLYLKFTGQFINDEDYHFQFTTNSYANLLEVEIYDKNQSLLYNSNGAQSDSYLNNSFQRYRSNGDSFFYMKITNKSTATKSWLIKPYFAKRIRNISINTPSVTFKGAAVREVDVTVTPSDAFDVVQVTLQAQETNDLTTTKTIENGIIHFKLYNNKKDYAPTITTYLMMPNARLSYPDVHTIPSYYDDSTEFANGEGTYENPYLVSTKEELIAIGNEPWASYRQVNDIDLTGIDWNPIGRTSYVDGWVEGVKFSGYYDGGNFKIIGLTSELFSEISPMYDGMGNPQPVLIENIVFQSPRIIKERYACTLSWYVYSANIYNCHVIDGHLEAPYSGGIGGHVSGYGEHPVEINGCSFEGTIKGDNYVGGIAYQVFSYDAIRNCTAKGHYTYINSNSWSYMGGVLGYISMNKNAVVENCHFEGSITSTNYAGGVIGYCSSLDTIKDCTAKGDIKTIMNNSSHYVGGITAYFNAYGDNRQMINCHSTCNIEGNYYSGGLAAYMSGVDKVIDCSSNGNVIGKAYTGGLIGYYSPYEIELSIIEKCYSVGNVTGLNIDTSGYYLGGFIGYLSRGIIKNSYSQGSVSGRSYVGGFIGSASLYGDLENVYCQSEKVEAFDQYSNTGAMFGYCTFNESGQKAKNSFAIVDEVITAEGTSEYNVGNIAGYTSDTVTLENVFVLDTLKIQSGHMRQATGTVTKEQAKQMETYKRLGWNFDSIWVIQEGVSYPVFKLVEFAVYLKNKGTWKEAQAMYSKVKGKWQQITAIQIKNKGKWQ